MSNVTAPAVELVNVVKRYGKKTVLDGVSIAIAAGERMVVLGPSGTGKSVLLRHINGLERPDSGEVRVFGQNIVPLTERELIPVRLKVSMLFQGGALFDSMNVFENVAFPLREHAVAPASEISERVARTLEVVGLPGTQKKMPSELSGGMRKRVALARSIVLEPEMVLFDEPTTGLDPVTAEKINELIVDLNRRIHATFVVVTHDITSARTVASRIGFLDGGRFEFQGTFAEAIRRPPPTLADFFRSQHVPCGPGVAA